MHHNQHPTDLQKACTAFIASLRAPAHSHAIYGQTRVSPTGAIEQVIVLHRHPKASQDFRIRRLPMSFGGYHIIEQDWPVEDL